MQTMNLQQLAQIVEGDLVMACNVAANDVVFTAVSTDTRSINAGELFVALKGEHYNADAFVAQAQEKGAIAALVSADSDVSLPYVKVEDVQAALSKLAKEERKTAGIPIVAVTGSNGKTTVKEMLASILGQSNTVLATAGNFNNHIGVPLTLLRLTAEHQMAIVEMGASHAGEIQQLCEIASPNVSILNNVGSAHLEGFGSLQGVANAKGEIISGLSESGVAILNSDEPWFADWCELAGGRKIISFGFAESADVYVDQSSIKSGVIDGLFKTQFTLNYQQQSVVVSLKQIGLHNVQNAMAACAASIALMEHRYDY
jgi:UDP-N-acetylmuramoyl-tripeptide--D-alanyl-D-alanine ligase